MAIHTPCLLWPGLDGLLFWGEDLRLCGAMTDTLAPVGCACRLGVISLEFCSGPSVGSL